MASATASPTVHQLQRRTDTVVDQAILNNLETIVSLLNTTIADSDLSPSYDDSAAAAAAVSSDNSVSRARPQSQLDAAASDNGTATDQSSVASIAQLTSTATTPTSTAAISATTTGPDTTSTELVTLGTELQSQAQDANSTDPLSGFTIVPIVADGVTGLAILPTDRNSTSTSLANTTSAVLNTISNDPPTSSLLAPVPSAIVTETTTNTTTTTTTTKNVASNNSNTTVVEADPSMTNFETDTTTNTKLTVTKVLPPSPNNFRGGGLRTVNTTPLGSGYLAPGQADYIAASVETPMGERLDGSISVENTDASTMSKTRLTGTNRVTLDSNLGGGQPEQGNSDAETLSLAKSIIDTILTSPGKMVSSVVLPALQAVEKAVTAVLG